MSAQISVVSTSFDIHGDGVATEARLSVYGFPFPSIPGLTPSAVSAGSSGGGRVASVALDGTEIVLTFSSAFSDTASGVSCRLYFDIPA